MANNNNMNIAVRGDDDVFALLNEMSHAATAGSSGGNGGGGEGGNAAPKTNGVQEAGRRCNENDNIVTQQPGRMMTPQLLGCNPHVEIIRHRQHEKFKASFYDLFRAQCSTKNNINNNINTNKSDKTGSNNNAAVRNFNQQQQHQQQQQKQHIIRSTISTIWKSVPPHTIWERFQFSLKTLEAQCVRELEIALADNSSNTITNHSTIPSTMTIPMQQQQLQHLAFPTVHQLYSHIIHNRSRGTYWEPLLPVPSIMTCTSHSGNDGNYNNNSDNDELRGRTKVNERYRRETLQLLRGEIEFQFRRVYKKVVGTKKGGDLPTLFLQLGRGGGDDGQKRKPTKKTKMNGRPNKKFMDDKDGVNCNDDIKNASNEKEEQHNEDNDKDDGEKKEEYILQTIFESQPFQKIALKLHKKFFHLAEETYCAFLVEIQKCSNRLMEEERQQAASCCVRGVGGSRKKKKQKQKDNHGMPRITVVETEHDDDDHAGAEMDRQFNVTFMGISLRINDWHQEKLMSLYERTLSKCLRLKCDIRQLQQHFPKLLFSLLLRYDALEGSGLQSAIPPSVSRYLHRRFGCEFECFASPFNCYWSVKDDIGSGGGGGVGGRYGSAYGDTDAMFGSYGSFFDLDFLNLSHGRGSRGGCYQANPPFTSEFIEKMYHRMHHFLTLSEQASGGREVDSHDLSNEEVEEGGNEMDNIPLMFVVFVPAWSKCAGWRMLSSSPFLTKHIRLSQKEDVHYYAEGTQHRRKRHHSSSHRTHDNKNGKEGHRIASFDTSVFFLQNSWAKARWPVIVEDEKLLKDAFAMTPTNSDNDNTTEEGKMENISRGETTKRSIASPEVPRNRGNCASKSSELLTKKKGSAKRKKSKVLDSAELKQEGGGAGAKKKRLVEGGQDELRILASMRILNDGGAK